MEFFKKLVEEFELYEQKLPKEQIISFLKKEGHNYPLLIIAMKGYVMNDILNKKRIGDYFVLGGVDDPFEMTTIFLKLFYMHLHQKYIFTDLMK